MQVLPSWDSSMNNLQYLYSFRGSISVQSSADVACCCYFSVTSLEHLEQGQSGVGSGHRAAFVGTLPYKYESTVG